MNTTSMNSQQASLLLSQLSEANWKLEVSTSVDGTSILLSVLTQRMDLYALLASTELEAVPTEVRVASRISIKQNPGVFLSTKLIAANITKKALGDALEVSGAFVNGILEGINPISAHAALMLEKHFPHLEITADIWVQMQSAWTLSQVRKQKST